jgi:ParB-like chromosome segregation protein Spo0J
MRKFYPVDQVREMADSILASKGVLEPLIITRDKGGNSLVIDGNMRLAGARLLGDKCPSLECKVVDQSAAEQLLSMAIVNQVRYDVDPVSEGLHYKALQAEGLTVREISKRTGIYEARIINRKILADLEPEIQQLIIDGKLPSSHLVAGELLKLPPKVRVRLAIRAAANPNTKIQTIIKACQNLAVGDIKKKLKRPAAQIAGIEDLKGEITAKELRMAVAHVCKTCNQFDVTLMNGRAPAWSMVAHAADETCSSCDLKEMQTVCKSCPAVELLRNLKVAKGGNRGA